MIENGLRIEWLVVDWNGAAWAELCTDEADVTGRAEGKRIANPRYSRLPACATIGGTVATSWWACTGEGSRNQYKIMRNGMGWLASARLCSHLLALPRGLFSDGKEGTACGFLPDGQ